MVEFVIYKCLRYSPYYYRHIGCRVIFAFLLTGLAGLPDSFGRAVILPLMEVDISFTDEFIAAQDSMTEQVIQISIETLNSNGKLKAIRSFDEFWLRPVIFEHD